MDERTHRQAAIADHGAIGNLETVALVDTAGTVDYLCWPCLDSPTIFATLLDAEEGGAFAVAPDLPGARVIQMYLPETNVLMTRWIADHASFELTDTMPVDGQGDDRPPRLIRRLTCTRGSVRVQVRCAPRFDYARRRCRAWVERTDGTVSRGHFDGESGLALTLHGPAPLVADGDDLTADVTLGQDQSAWLVLSRPDDATLDAPALCAILDADVAYWRGWIRRSNYAGRWREVVERSALTLKLLTSRRHGSIAAAATFGLPEAPGGVRNWDYRATWIRDSSFTVYALIRLGFEEEAVAFLHWAMARAQGCSKGHLGVVYALDGGEVQDEQDLDLAGFRGAAPIRIGNGANDQVQHDIYGALLDATYLGNKYGEAISHDAWEGIQRVVDHVCDTWKKPDSGIWEVRGKKREYLHSRLMNWVAVDRALRLAGKRSLPAPFDRWVKTRTAINEDIWANFWLDTPEGGHFVRSKGETAVDAALLMMPLVRFVGPTDPRWLSTLARIEADLSDDGLIHRYRVDDGLPGEEGSFVACSFWYVECLARAGRLDEARLQFDKLLAHGNHLSLFAEEIGRDGALLGNFPQGFSHLALISAAFYLDRALDGEGKDWA